MKIRISELANHLDENVKISGWVYNIRSIGKIWFLILFLMGGSFFLFLGVFYIYYKVYRNIKDRNKKVKKFFKGEMDAAEVEEKPGQE